MTVFGFRVASLALAISLAAVVPEAAASDTIGGVIASVGRDTILPVMALLWGGSTVVGIYLVASGGMKIVQHVGREEIPYREILGRLLGGGAIHAFWFTVGASPVTLFGFADPQLGVAGGSATAGALAGGNCITDRGGGLTCMAANFSSNVVPTFMVVAWGLAMLWGAWLVITGVHALATQSERGGSNTSNPFPRMIYGGLLIQLPFFIASVSRTMGYSNPVVGGSGFISNTANLAYRPPGGIPMLDQWAQLIGHVFVIMAMFGVIAVWKGIAYLKAGAEGEQRGVVGAGLTHIIGGAMLVNSKTTTCFVMNTMIGTGLNFCSS